MTPDDRANRVADKWAVTRPDFEAMQAEIAAEIKQAEHVTYLEAMQDWHLRATDDLKKRMKAEAYEEAAKIAESVIHEEKYDPTTLIANIIRAKAKELSDGPAAENG